MPIIPGGEPSGGDPGGGGGGTILPCPGVCPVWPGKYIYCKIPGGTSYVCGMSAPVPIAPTTTYLQLVRGDTPGWVNGRCGGTGWYGVSVTTPDPMVWEGTATLRIFVCCTNEKLSYPVIWVYYEDHIRLIGEPDPDVSACLEAACMTTIRCECYGIPDSGLPGYTHGTATLPNTDLPLYYGTCDCNIAVIGGGEEFEVKGYGFGACDCTGIPLSMPVTLECAGDFIHLLEVASGSMAYTEADSVTIPALTGPHWEGTMTGGSGCVWDVGLTYNPVVDSLAYYFILRGDPPCSNPCPEIDPVATSSASNCDPFYVQINYNESGIPPANPIFRFTIGTPP